MKNVSSRWALGFLMTTISFFPSSASAHCDGLDGPVVSAARLALETGDVTKVLIWVRQEDEAEIRNAFSKTRSVRKLSTDAKELADLYFFETLVRIHRAGEGEPYDGLKPAGRDLGPAIPAADKAVATGSADPVVKLINESLHRGIELRFAAAMQAKAHAAERPGDLEAGRRYVHAYVSLLHYIENVYAAAAAPAGDGHSDHATEDGHREK